MDIPGSVVHTMLIGARSPESGKYTTPSLRILSADMVEHLGVIIQGKLETAFQMPLSAWLILRRRPPYSPFSSHTRQVMSLICALHATHSQWDKIALAFRGVYLATENLASEVGHRCFPFFAFFFAGKFGELCSFRNFREQLQIF